MEIKSTGKKILESLSIFGPFTFKQLKEQGIVKRGMLMKYLKHMRLHKPPFIETKSIHSGRGHPKYLYLITDEGQKYLAEKSSANGYPTRTIYDVDLHEIEKTKKKTEKAEGRDYLNITISKELGHDIDQNLIAQATERILLQSASEGCSKACFTLNVSAQLSRQIAGSLKYMEDLRKKAEEEGEMFKRFMLENLVWGGSYGPLLPSWVVNFIWTNYAIWGAIYPDNNIPINRIKSYSLDLMGNPGWQADYAWLLLERVDDLLKAFEEAFRKEAKKMKKVMDKVTSLSSFQLSLPILEDIGFEPQRLQEIKTESGLDSKEALDFWNRASGDRSSPTLNLALEAFLGEPQVKRSGPSQPESLAVIYPSSWTFVSLAEVLKAFLTTERKLETYDKMLELLDTLGLHIVKPMDADDETWIRAAYEVGIIPSVKGLAPEFVIRIRFLQIVKLLARIASDKIKGKKELEKEAEEKAYAITDLLYVLTFQVNYAVNIRRKWHFPYCPYCGDTMTRPESSHGKYLVPFICPNCKANIPEDTTELQSKRFDEDHLRFLALEESKAIEKTERAINRDLLSWIKKLQRALRKDLELDDLYELGIREDFIDHVMEERKKGKNKVELSDELHYMSDIYFKRFVPFLRDYRSKMASMYIWDKKEFENFLKVLIEEEERKPLTVDDLKKARSEVEDYIQKLKARGEFEDYIKKLTLL